MSNETSGPKAKIVWKQSHRFPPVQAMRLLSTLRSPVIVFVAALALRVSLASNYVGLVSATGNLYLRSEPAHVAAHIARGEGFSSPYNDVPLAPTAQQPPLYPLLFGGVFRVFGVYSRAAFWVITEFNAVVGAGICPLILLVGRKYLSCPAGMIAAWIWALSPAVVTADLFGSHYPLSAAVVLIWLLILPDLIESPSGWWTLGIALGLATLLNPALFLLLPASAGWLLHKLKQAAAITVVSVLVIAPWIIRNYAVLGHFYPIRDNFALELYIGNHAGMKQHFTRSCSWNLCDGTDDYSTAEFPDHSQLFVTAGEAAFMEAKRQEAIAFIRAEPAAFLIRCAKRAASFWLLPYPWLYLPIFVLMCAGIAQIPGPPKTFFLTMLALYPISFYVTQVAWTTSYRHPIEPLMLLGAGFALPSWGNSRSSVQRLLGGMFARVGAGTNW